MESEKTDCHFVSDNPFEKFAIINIANNGSIASHLFKEISRATEFLLERR